jgi:hypothetical protein
MQNWYFNLLGAMATCTKSKIDKTSAGYDTEELILSKDTFGYLVSCKQCIHGIVREIIPG